MTALLVTNDTSVWRHLAPLRDYTDVSCNNAMTDNMTAPQEVPLGPNPAQFDALRPDTDLVTVTISGNDIGFTDWWATRGSCRPPSGAIRSSP